MTWRNSDRRSTHDGRGIEHLISLHRWARRAGGGHHPSPARSAGSGPSPGGSSSRAPRLGSRTRKTGRARACSGTNLGTRTALSLRNRVGGQIDHQAVNEYPEACVAEILRTERACLRQQPGQTEQDEHSVRGKRIPRQQPRPANEHRDEHNNAVATELRRCSLLRR